MQLQSAPEVGLVPRLQNCYDKTKCQSSLIRCRETYRNQRQGEVRNCHKSRVKTCTYQISLMPKSMARPHRAPVSRAADPATGTFSASSMPLPALAWLGDGDEEDPLWATPLGCDYGRGSRAGDGFQMETKSLLSPPARRGSCS